MSYLIAIDGGGTKTESVLFHESGEVIGRDITQGVNALDVGITLAEERVSAAIARLAALIPGSTAPDVIYGGLAGCVDYFPGVMYNYLRSRFTDGILRMEGDGGSLIAAMQGHSDGAGLIAGTGSSLYIRSGNVLQRYGGWGPLIDTEGSGYKLGIHAFYAAFRALDSRGPDTVLYDLIAEQMGAKPENCLPEIYAKGRPYISLFAQCVFKGRRMGDEVATKIFDDAVHCLAELVEIGERVLQKNFNVYTGGGLFASFPEYLEALQGAVPNCATLIPIDTEPIYGAAAEALWDIGLSPTPEFKARFMSSYDALVISQNQQCGRNTLDFDVIYKAN